MCVLLTLTAVNVQAGTYYVAPSGQDSATGSLSAPWKTLSHAASSASAGDTIYLRAGSYAGYVKFTTSGSANSPITIEAYPGENPVIDGANRPTPLADPWQASDVLLYISGDYVVIRGLEIKNYATFGIYINGDHVTIDKVHAHHGYFAGIYFMMASYGLVTDNLVHDVYDYGPGGVGGGGNADCIGSSASNAPTAVFGYHTFRNNLVYNCSDDGIDTWTSQFNILEGNTVHHAGYSNASNGGSQSTGEVIGNGNGFKLGKGGNNVVRFNVAYANATSGFDDNSGPGNQLYNNTAFNTGGPFLLYTPGQTAKNNLSFGGNNVLSGNLVLSHNSWELGITNPGFASTDPGSPLFLRLLPASAAIDQGVDVGLPFNGTAPDLGAYETQSVSTVAPAPPTGLVVE